MASRKPRRVTTLVLLALLAVFLATPPRATAAQRPRLARVTFTARARVKLTRRGGQVVPLELHMGGKTFPFVRGGGRWGVVLRASEMARLAPELSQQLALQVGAMATTRIRELVHGNRTAAHAIVENQRRGGGKGLSGDERALMNRMESAWRQVMAQQAFFFPEIQPDVPGQGGWWFVDDQSGSGDADHTGEDEEEEEDETSWFTDLMGIIMVVVLTVAPVAAALWLAAQALTIATVTAAFLGSIGAVTAAATFVTTMCGIEHLVTGHLYECWGDPPSDPHYPPGNHY